jgi:hypothetical protein
MDKKWRREEGTVIVVAVFVVMALVMMGSLSIMLSNIERDISGNDKMGKEAFFVADAGTPISTKILEDMILNEGIDHSDPSYVKYMLAGITFDSSIFINEVRNYYDPVLEPELNDAILDSPDNMPDITATVAGKALNIDVDWRHRKSGAGGSLLFAMGYEGIGADRSRGGVKTYYNIDSQGELSKTKAEIKAIYLSQ